MTSASNYQDESRSVFADKTVDFTQTEERITHQTHQPRELLLARSAAIPAEVMSLIFREMCDPLTGLDHWSQITFAASAVWERPILQFAENTAALLHYTSTPSI